MVTCTEVLLAQTILIDSITKKTSAINILENMRESSLPAIIPIQFYATFIREIDDDLQPNISLVVKNNDKVIHKSKLNIDFIKDDNIYARNIIQPFNIAVESEGKLSFIIINSDGNPLMNKDIIVMASSTNVTVV